MKKTTKRLLIFIILLNVFLVFGCSNIQVNKGDVKNLNVKEYNNTKSEDNQVSFIDEKYFYSKMDSIKPSDEIGVIVTLSRDSILDNYNKNLRKYSNVSELLNSSTGQKLTSQMEKEQTILIDKLVKNHIIKEVRHSYTTLLNGFYARIEYKNLARLEKYMNVEKVVISDVYNVPKTVAVTNNVQVYDTGIFDSSNVKYSGANTSVAVLDSGFDTEHTVFQNMPRNPILNKDIIDDKLKSLVAYSYNDTLISNNVYYNSKVPYAYDYADKDSDVSPYDSNHGTHVASIIGGKDDKITGVAVDTQLVLLKVFSDYKEGAEEGDILAALEDAVILNVDAINMSLGTSCGFTREQDGHYINTVYDKVKNAGISLVVAASNDYSSAFGGALGNTNKTLNPDSGTVGSPATYAASLSVASINGQLDKYIIGNNEQAFFFHEASNNSGKDYSFFNMLNLNDTQTLSFDYVTVPGLGLKANYQAINVKDKIALVKRGDISFEEKAKFAYEAGAKACIIYNNIFGDIKMSLGNNLRIPTISISKDDGDILAKQSTGVLKISNRNLAGPFMSDFSSWGPTPSLNIKPEITAHGGNILAAIAGGGYDSLSGTSMASPNMCGVIILIRQYVKENLSAVTTTPVEVTNLVNQLCMSTTNIALNQQGNPYSPRKQGAGLASLYNAVNSKAFIYVDDNDRPKIELKDDKEKTGKYTLKFNVRNLTDDVLRYDVNTIVLTESVSTSDDKFVSEFSHLLKGNTTLKIEGETSKNREIKIEGKKTVKVEVQLDLTKEDKAYLNKYFKNGMYVEGFVNLTSKNEDKIDLNVPYLAFYGAWDYAPIFDKTYYEVDSDLQNDAIDEEDKLKADYYKTTPLGKYYKDYIIPLGTYVYKIDQSKYNPIIANMDKIALSYDEEAISGIYAVYAGLLRNAKEMNFTVTNSKTGEVVFEKTSYNNTKAHYNSGVRPNFESLEILPEELNLQNNVKYDFKMAAKLDFDSNENSNNTFEFSFYVDYEAPTIQNAQFYKEYDRIEKKNRFYMDLSVYDNHYVQAIRPSTIVNQKLVTLSDYPIPVYGERNSKTKVKVEITDYLDQIKHTEYPNTIFFAMDDYAMNSNIFMISLDDTDNTELKFSKESMDLYIGDEFDLTNLITPENDYYKNMVWTSSDELIVKTKDGQVEALSEGTATIHAKGVSVYSESKNINISITINVLPTSKAKNVKRANNPSLEEVKFSGYDTVFAFLDDNNTSEIGKTGERNFLGQNTEISFYPSEKIKMLVDVKPWNLDFSKYEMVWSSSNSKIATVNQNGEIQALKEGSTNITLRFKNIESGKFSNISSRVKINVKNEFIIESRYLVGYKGFGGNVVIPESLGIMFIAPYAFCLYEIDEEIVIENPEDYDNKKVPIGNKNIESIVIPEGVEEISKFAFYKTEKLKSVILPKSLKIIREYSFNECNLLESINLDNVSIIGERAFYGCTNLENINTVNLITIGKQAFANCNKINHLNLVKLRNTGVGAFENCTGLTSVELGEGTKLSNNMFEKSGLESITIKGSRVPNSAFKDCARLKTVIIENNLLYLGSNAFENCKLLSRLTFKNGCEYIGEKAFSNTGLINLVLPNSDVFIDKYAFEGTKLMDVTFSEKTYITQLGTSVFSNCNNLVKFYTVSSNQNYSVDANRNVLYNKDKTEIILVATGFNFGNYVIAKTVKKISESAFSGNNLLTAISFETGSTLTSIGKRAFNECINLVSVSLPNTIETIENEAFFNCIKLNKVLNIEKIKLFGQYAFSNTALVSVDIRENAIVNLGAFFKCSKLIKVILGDFVDLGDACFAESKVETVHMPTTPSIKIGKQAFFNVQTLKNIDLSKAMGKIGDFAFFNCINLEKADLDNVVEIGEYAFGDCAKLRFVSLTNVEVIGKNAFAKVNEKGVAPTFSSLSNTNKIKEVGSNAFYGCASLTSIHLPMIESIDKEAFAFCTSLKTVVLGDKITVIDEKTFYGNKKLQEINLKNIKTLYDYAFAECKELTNLDLSSVEMLFEGVFFNCSGLTSVDLKEAHFIGVGAFASSGLISVQVPKVKTIETLAFMKTNISEIVLPDSVEFIGKQAFFDCKNLTSFYTLNRDNKVDTKAINDYLTLDQGVLYTVLPNGKFMLSSYPVLKEDKVYQVLNHTARIEFAAARYNKFIEHVIFPYDLTLIGDFAFAGCDNLKEVSFNSYFAPTLEGTLTEKITPDKTLMGRYEELFEYSMYIYPYFYFNFKDAVGFNTVGEIKMNYPVNGKGYDVFLYDLYFSVSNNTLEEVKDEFVEFVLIGLSKLPTLENITLKNEKLIKEIRTAYNKIDFNNVHQSKYLSKELEEQLKQAEEKIETLREKIEIEEPMVPIVPPNEPDNSNVLFIILGSIAGVLVLGGIGIGLITYLKSKKNKKEEA